MGSFLIVWYVVESPKNARILFFASSTIISFSCFKAFCSLEVMLDGGILDLRSEPIICSCADSATFLFSTLQKADSTFGTILGIVLLVGVAS